MSNGDRATGESCPDCGEEIVYNGNYFCENFGRGCNWALPHDEYRPEVDSDVPSKYLDLEKRLLKSMGVHK